MFSIDILKSIKKKKKILLIFWNDTSVLDSLLIYLFGSRSYGLKIDLYPYDLQRKNIRRFLK